MSTLLLSWITGSVFWAWMPQLLHGARDTLVMAIISFVLSMILALPLALARMSSWALIRQAAIAAIEVLRGTPLLTQLFVIYFSLEAIISLDAFTAAVVGLTLNTSAYLAEIYRAGIIAVDRGQREAAQSIGMTRLQTMRYVVLPQAFRVVIPPLASYAVIVLKSTSLASIVSAPDLMMQAHDLSSEYFMPMEVYLLTAAIYIAMAYPLSRSARWLEIRFSRGRV